MAEERFIAHINLNGNEIKNAIIEKLGAAPSTPAEGRIYYNTTDKVYYYYDGTEWIQASGTIKSVTSSSDDITASTTDGDVTITFNPSNISHGEFADTGTNTHAQIDTHIGSTSNPHQVSLEQARSQSNTLSGQIDMGSNKIVNVTDPTASQDAATKAYVDAVAQGLDPHEEVDTATTEALPANTAAGSQVGKTLTGDANGALTIDGRAVLTGDRVLVNNEVTDTNNGIYVVTDTGDAGTPYVLTRATDFDGSPAAEIAAGDFFFVKFGATNASSGWVLRAYNGADPVVDTDPLVFAQFSGAGTYTAGSGLTLTGNQFSTNGAAIAGDGLKVGALAHQVAVKSDITTGATVAGASVGANGVGTKIDNSTITKDGSEVISVAGYTPISGATVARKVFFDNQAVINGDLVLAHNLGTKDIQVIVEDTADGSIVRPQIKNTSTTSVTISSNQAITADITVIG